MARRGVPAGAGCCTHDGRVDTTQLLIVRAKSELDGFGREEAEKDPLRTSKMPDGIRRSNASAGPVQTDVRVLPNAGL